jgi:prepilin peptidase CpaA
MLDFFPILLLSTILIIASVYDYRVQRIPNFVSYPGMLVAVLYHTILTGFDGLMFSVAGLLLGVALLILPYMLGGMGAGDAKLLGAVGAVIGAKGVFFAFILSALAGGIYALILIGANRHNFRERLTNYYRMIVCFIYTRQYTSIPQETEDRVRLCYGLAIAAGTAVYMGLNMAGVTLSIN